MDWLTPIAVKRALIGGGGATSGFDETQGPIGIGDAAPWGWSDQADLGETGLHGRLGDAELRGQLTDVADAGEPEPTQHEARHQQTAGEVVAYLLDEVVTLRGGDAFVEDVDEAMVEDVLELVRQAEALAANRFAAAQQDHPAALGPSRGAGHRQRTDVFDLQSREIGDRFSRQQWAELIGEPTELRGLQFGNPQGALARERGDRDDVAQSSDDRPGFMPAFGAAARAGSAISFAHTHPGGRLDYSELDEIVDAQLAPVAHVRTGGRPYVSVVIAGGDVTRLAARFIDDTGAVHDVDRFRIVGAVIGLHTSESRDGKDEGAFDRQVRAFGDIGQRVLGSLRVGVVGVGGTGSATVEQLVRLGVGELVVADYDTVERSNVSRIYGSTMKDVARSKIDVVTEHAARIGFETKIVAVEGNITDRHVAERYRHCDVIFGCTDDHAGRGVISRLAYWYLIPTFDVGVIVGSAGGRVTEEVGRVTYLAPGQPCLLCRHRISPEMIAAESLSTEERTRLELEGYVPGLGTAAPAVVTLTSLVAATATTELLNRLFDIGTADSSSELLLRAERRQVRRTEVEPVDGHFCIDPAQWAQGDAEPFLGQLWVSQPL